ncbi:MAG: hypothetical protein R6U32_04685 [Candidatus Woesearchaeota archaeon]
MAETIKDRMIRRGWPEEEAEQAMQIINSEEKKEKHKHFKMSMNFVVYWTVLLVLTLANFVISIVLVPFLLVLKPFLVEMIVAVMAIIFGLLFNLVVRDIEHIETKHHVAAAVFIPAVAIINIFIMVNIANTIAERIDLSLQQNPVFVSLIYAAVFLLPYGFTSLREYLKSRKEGQGRQESGGQS